MPDSFDLRSRAENRFRATCGQLAAKPPHKLQDLVQELQIRQIELEMQNEELCRMQDELRASRQKYADLYEFAPLGYLTLTREGIIVEVNFLARLWLAQPRNELIGRKFSSFVAPQCQDDYFIHYRQVFDTGGRQSCELELLSQSLYVQANSQINIPDDGYCCTTLTDITHMVEPNRPARKMKSDSPQARPPDNVMF